MFRKQRVYLSLLVLASTLVLWGCQSEGPVLKEQGPDPNASNPDLAVPYSRGPTSPPSVKGPTTPPPSGDGLEEIPQAVTEVDEIKITLPASTDPASSETEAE